LPETLLTRIRARARRERLLARKRAYRLAHPWPRHGRKAVVLVVGCQRSGTTLMLELFNADRRSVTFPEQSALSLPAEDRLRLKPLPEVKSRLERIRAPLLVLKPLVESQHAPAWLDGLDDSYAIWMYRRPESVAMSDLSYFGSENGERNLRLLLSNEPPNWRGEVVPEETRSVISRHYRPGMDPYDAAALFWWARTSLFFDLRLDERSDVRLCSYEQLVADPESSMRSLYDFVGVPYPEWDITRGVHRRSAGRNKDLPLSTEVRQRCEELWERLERVDSRSR
jgi:Sulfotransferase domain